MIVLFKYIIIFIYIKFIINKISTGSELVIIKINMLKTTYYFTKLQSYTININLNL